jgi:hypothetical protein
MKLVRIVDGVVTVTRDRPIHRKPIDPVVLANLRNRIDSPEEGALIQSLIQRHWMGAAALAPMPVGGEDAYLASLKR